jgi:chitin synthase
MLSQGGGNVTDSSGRYCGDLDEDDNEQADLDDDRDMTHQSNDAMRNRKWKPAESEAWLNDKSLRRADRDYLEGEEESFWKDVIERYLQPIVLDVKEQDRIHAGLTDLRNKVLHNVVVSKKPNDVTCFALRYLIFWRRTKYFFAESAKKT